MLHRLMTTRFPKLRPLSVLAVVAVFLIAATVSAKEGRDVQARRHYRF